MYYVMLEGKGIFLNIERKYKKKEKCFETIWKFNLTTVYLHRNVITTWDLRMFAKFNKSFIF